MSSQGWVKSTDPKTGRVFYANHITRKTQWDPPEGWVEEAPSPPAFQDSSAEKEEEPSPLPSNWEVMHDPTTGKPFYVDHERKITTWSRPKASSEKHTTASFASSLKPAVASPPSSGNASSAALARILAQQQSYAQPQARSYQQEASYYSSPASHTVDFSDSLPALEFQVQTVADALRPNCANCDTQFTYSKRRHHCRLCGDVFCDACSSHRVTLPLEGAEFDKPVRVCDTCHADVEERGNFFSFRRYLTPLHLSQPGQYSEDGVTSVSNINAALAALTTDVNQMLQNPVDNPMDRISIAPTVLIPELWKHLKPTETADRSMCAIAALLALEAMADQTALAAAIYQHGQVNDILSVLERSGTDRRTLYVQEQAARTVCYLTDAKVTQHVEHDRMLDIPRAMRNMLDHSSTTRNPNLQRWSAACLTHLIQEDQRRSCLAVNDVAAAVASGEQRSAPSVAYESFLEQLLSTGGIMILGSLVGTDDADTRAHAVAALAATLTSTRAVAHSYAALAEMTGQAVANLPQDAAVVRAIVAAGGCGDSVSQLLLSADDAVAGMGIQFLSSLVAPLLQDATAGASLHPSYDYRTDESTVGACREAAIELADGSACLPALLSLVRGSRPVELRQLATETLAAVVYAIGEMGRVWARGKYEEGLADAPGKLSSAMLQMQHEGVLDTALAVLQSGQSLGSSGSRETPSSRIREAAGICLGALTSCSAEAILDLQSRQILSSLILASTDANMTVASTLRGDSSPRCLGVLETVASILMFAWQHPSGASSELLDRLIEVIDAGVIPYISKVLNSKIDWESRDKAVGAMKGRTAACRLLCCVFGIALTDPTAIGMRRLMEAVETDARAYRGTTERAPSNLIEAALSVLQTASSLARKALLGSLSQGPHYQAALMDLVDASLLAAGSMCGSSVAPGGSEGSLISGVCLVCVENRGLEFVFSQKHFVSMQESFLSVRTDAYVSRRNEICKVACDVVVRGGRQSPALLPTMLVGGFGEDAVLSSLRLALAIAQNGTKDQHAKLALSGILVPISDSLRSALSKGDLYKFSAALALVRFCGPHMAAGHGGGLESVRDAIRVATNVLTLPINPDASLEQIENQESLKSECISLLESLSHNASLWSSISTDALPSIVSYLHTTSAITATNPRRQQTRCAALRAVLQIVQVPSHAVSAAAAGIVEPLGRLISSTEVSSQEDEVPMLALEVLHVIASNDQARQTAKFLDTGLVRSIFAALGNSATDQPKKPSDSRADVTFLGLEIIHGVLSDIEDGASTAQILQSPQAIALLDAVATEARFVRAMCSTLLLKTNMKLRRHDSEDSGEAEYEIPRLYGPPLILVPEKCATYENTHDASAALLFRVSVYACAIESKRSDAFWKAAFLKDLGARVHSEDASRTAATLCAHFLSLLTSDHKPFVPTEKPKKDDYVTLTRPLVRHRLLETLKNLMKELSGEVTYGPSADPYVTSLLVEFNLPHICLSLWKDPALLDLAFELLRQIVDQDPEEVLHLFVEGKAAIESLFDLLNVDSSVETSQNVGEIKSFLASVLGQLAENGMLTEAVEKYDVRSSAIAALAAACLGEEERPPDEDEDMTSNRLSSVLMRCLVDLCSVVGKDGQKKRIQLSPGEAEAMAKNLGKKICQMVIARFLERARLQQYEMEEDECIMDAPDVAMLCAIAQHKDALLNLRSIGGLHALSLIAAEGELSALVALKVACSNDVSNLLEGDTYAAMMKMIAHDNDTGTAQAELEAAAFDLLGRLCLGSAKGRNAVAADANCEGCLAQAMHIVSSFVTEGDALLMDSQLAGAEDAGPAVDTDEEKLEDEPASNTGDDTVQKATVSLQLAKGEEDKVELGVAACSFLQSLAATKIGSQAVRDNMEFAQALEYIAGSEAAVELRFATLKLLTGLSRVSSRKGPLTPDSFAGIMLSVLSSNEKILPTESLNKNRLTHAACNGLAAIFDLVSSDKQKKLVLATAMQWTNAVKACIVTRATTKAEEREFAAEAAYSLTRVLLLARGKDYVNEVFGQELLISMVHLLQWRHDPKTSLGNTNKRFWNASVSNCLILLSSLIWRPEEELAGAGLDIKSLAGTTLMLARAGKAPRRAIDLKSVLDRLVDGTDDVSAVPAQHLRDLLFA